MDARIGQILSRLAPLSDHDVEEILQEQKTTRQRFGEAALALGLVQPEHVWEAWIRQVQERHTPIDLGAVGIDTQALDYVPASVARQFRLVPVRAWHDELVIASSRVTDECTIQQIESQIGLKLIVALAPQTQVDAAIERYYPQTPTTEAA